ncbi:MAG: AbrB/MazE/SpoVT family DNA-binding domain-containing protein [Deltaproteobacteria bacterium]|nr:MAG: AbrB/MazE/SpoVT family DNA-binding domain-containing protein [Deltaproteobacteria bacterium]
MEIALSSWGNSLGLRIPKAIADLFNFKSGSKLRMELSDKKIILSAIDSDGPDELKKMSTNIDLKKMTSKVTSKNKHHLQDWADDEIKGKEIW